MKLSSVVHRKNVLWTSITVMLLVSVTMINIASASPDTYFYVDPPLIVGTPEGKVLIEINVADAPPSYAWEFRLSWDPDRLELVATIAGDFPIPGGVVVPLDEANLEGEVLALGTLLGEVPIEDWPSGGGTLIRLGFLVEAEGAVHINLFDTRLWDHLVYDPINDVYYPAPTFYPNEDCLVDATSFYFAGLAGWKLKVNGKAGTSTGGGLKTTVGTENLLEANVRNDGNYNVEVKVFFEIRDGRFVPIGPPIEADQGVVTLAPGESTILSTGWTADDADVYYIRAYAVYRPVPSPYSFFPSPEGLSKTVRLRAV